MYVLNFVLPAQSLLLLRCKFILLLFNSCCILSQIEDGVATMISKKIRHSWDFKKRHFHSACASTNSLNSRPLESVINNVQKSHLAELLDSCFLITICMSSYKT